MKVLVNGGLNLSELDGWWAEAYDPTVGWALGDRHAHEEPEWDGLEAAQLYDLLEREVVPAFYERNPEGLPTTWLPRVRASMARLTPRFSAARMLREYVDALYLPAARSYRRRSANQGELAEELDRWRRELSEKWRTLRFGTLSVTRSGDSWHMEVVVYGNELSPDLFRAEVYADPLDDGDPVRMEMTRCHPVAGAYNAFLYAADVPASRPAEHYTPRLVPHHPDAAIPLEAPFILWRR